jgi:hypothetical protein
MARPGTSTVGILLGFASYDGATAPSAYTLLTRINAIGGINLTTEQIDASALEDKISKFIKGRQDTGGSWTVTVNMTEETIAEWNAVQAADTGNGVAFDVYFPELNKSFIVYAQVPGTLPMPDVAQNSLATMEISLTINEYVGVSAPIVPSGTVSY